MVFYKGGNMFSKITDFLVRLRIDPILLVLLGISILMSAVICFIAKKNAEKELKDLKNVKK
jgi:hypothetical protein